ncbi:MAG TPA: phospholipase D-like domain-containing protein [Terriglobia bacterium]|nr:phospholipase D-like domain-containing protein [Terriglobia bacterium]
MAAPDIPIVPVAGNAPSSVRVLADQAFSRAAGAPLIGGNRVQLLRDAEENYPAWKKAIREARRTVHFESYIIHDDDIGREFADLFVSKAREGVHVRVLYDWMGAIARTGWSFWRRLRRAGVEVRCFNPPRVDSAFGWLSRDHRKTIIVDNQIAFVTGLCVGREWAGNPARRIAPWRDTGVSIEGPALPEVERAFASTWATCGAPLPESDLGIGRPCPEATGDVALRIIATQPGVASMYRLDQLIAAVARESIWLTDAYFLGTSSYVQALCAAAADGVDVRLLLPRASDVPFIRAVSRAGYRTLLEAGVRIFEWNGPMLHAKTAVADGRWARVGSTNLNIASWVSNWELDVIVEDEGFAGEMQAMYLDDLHGATEIVLSAKHHPSPVVPRGMRRRPRGAARGSATWAATGVLRLGKAVGAAVTSSRVLGPAEASVMLSGGLTLLGLVAFAVLLPKVVAGVLAFLAAWIALTLLVQAWRLRFPRKKPAEHARDAEGSPPAPLESP